MNYRKLLIRLFTFLGGIYFFLKFVLPEKITLQGESFEFGKYNDQITIGISAVGVASLGIGLVILFRQHGGALLHLRKGWLYSLALLIGLSLMFGFSIADWSAALRQNKLITRAAMLREFSARIETDYTNKVSSVKPVAERNAALVDSLNVLLNDITTFSDSRVVHPETELDASRLAASMQQLQENISKTRTLATQIPLSHQDPILFETHHALKTGLLTLSASFSEYFELAQRFSETKRYYNVFYYGLFVPLGSAMFSLLGFYIASAAYRAFRIRSVEAGLMMTAALIVILGQIPTTLFGEGETTISFFQQLNHLRFWILSQVNSAAFRAIEIGSAIAGLVIAVRMWLSIESESFTEEGRRQ